LAGDILTVITSKSIYN